jgi:hypothetical protein
MKKLLIGLSVLFLISGCGENNEKLTCTSTNTTNGMTTDTKYDIEYKDDKVKYVTITYDYKQDNTTTDTNTTDNTNDTDGVNADTDGTTNDNDDNNDGATTSDEVIDGAVGDTIDGVVDGVTNTILDIAGIKSTYDNQITSYKDIEGFSYEVKEDTDDEYKIVYKIDLDKISDSDLTRFNLDRDLTTVKSNYEDSGYTCS